MAKEDKNSHLYPGSVGRLVNGIEVEVVDKNDKQVLQGDNGRFRIKASFMTQGYFNNVKATEIHFKEGWFYPGDEGYINSDGYLFFNGRFDDMIAIQGAKYYPIEVERLLQSHKYIQEVAVMGCTTLEGQSSSIAVVKSTKALTEDDVVEFCLQNLASYKVPEIIVFTDNIAKTRTGKVAKKSVKNRFDKQGNLFSLIFLIQKFHKRLNY